MLRNSSTHFGAIIRLLHWAMALLIVAAIAAIEVHDAFPKGGSIRSALMGIHFHGGMIVLLLIWVRLAAVVTDKAPPIVPELSIGQDWAAKLTKITFYVAMIALPILGICMQQAGDRSINFFGMQLPTFIDPDKVTARSMKEIHEAMGNVMIGLIALHLVAALWHHFKLRDNTLLRMLPRRTFYLRDGSKTGSA